MNRPVVIQYCADCPRHHWRDSRAASREARMRSATSGGKERWGISNVSQSVMGSKAASSSESGSNAVSRGEGWGRLLTTGSRS